MPLKGSILSDILAQARAKTAEKARKAAENTPAAPAALAKPVQGTKAPEKPPGGIKTPENPQLSAEKPPLSAAKPNRFLKPHEKTQNTAEKPAEKYPQKTPEKPNKYQLIPSAEGEGQLTPLSPGSAQKTTGPTINAIIKRTPAGDFEFGRVTLHKPLEPYKIEREVDRGAPTGKFAKGHSGNPAGPPPTLSAYAYELTGGGLEMVDHATRMLRGYYLVKWTHEHTREEFDRMMPVPPKEQAEARKWLQEAVLPELLRRVQAQGEHEVYRTDRLTYEQLCVFSELMSIVTAPEPQVTGLVGQALPEGEPQP